MAGCWLGAQLISRPGPGVMILNSYILLLQSCALCWLHCNGHQIMYYTPPAGFGFIYEFSVLLIFQERSKTRGFKSPLSKRWMKPPGCYYYFDPCRWKVNCDSWKFVQSLICLVHKIFALRDIPWMENVKRMAETVKCHTMRLPPRYTVLQILNILEISS